MPRQRLDEKLVRGLEAPATGNRITYDADVKGFGVRMTAAGAKAFILNYTTAGRERRITIGSVPDWSVSGARDRAKELRARLEFCLVQLAWWWQMLMDVDISTPASICNHRETNPTLPE